MLGLKVGLKVGAAAAADDDSIACNASTRIITDIIFCPDVKGVLYY
jgi:hypothetical protein